MRACYWMPNCGEAMAEPFRRDALNEVLLKALTQPSPQRGLKMRDIML